MRNVPRRALRVTNHVCPADSVVAIERSRTSGNQLIAMMTSAYASGIMCALQFYGVIVVHGHACPVSEVHYIRECVVLLLHRCSVGYQFVLVLMGSLLCHCHFEFVAFMRACYRMFRRVRVDVRFPKNCVATRLRFDSVGCRPQTRCCRSALWAWRLAEAAPARCVMTVAAPLARTTPETRSAARPRGRSATWRIGVLIGGLCQSCSGPSRAMRSVALLSDMGAWPVGAL